MTTPPGFAAVVKVGGSLSHGPHLPTLCQALGRLARRHPLLIVPGGAAFADTVRGAADRYTLSDTAAHWMAILGMDQYGYLLADLIPGAIAAHDLAAAGAAAGAGQAAVLLPFTLLRHDDPLPHSWTVTSDAIAAWLCGSVGAALLTLLKDVDGLYSAPPPSRLIIAHISGAKGVGTPIKQRKGGMDLVQKSRTIHFGPFGSPVEKKMIHGSMHLAPSGQPSLHVVPQFWKDVGND